VDPTEPQHTLHFRLRPIAEQVALAEDVIGLFYEGFKTYLVTVQVG
jgi:hypothetical protein